MSRTTLVRPNGSFVYLELGEAASIVPCRDGTELVFSSIGKVTVTESYDKVLLLARGAGFSGEDAE